MSVSPKRPRSARFQGWRLFTTAVLSFAMGSLVTTYLAQTHAVRADGTREFELMVYHTIPGKVSELESVFRDVSKLQAKHGLNVIGYWVPNDDPARKNTFIYLVAHSSLEDAKRNWDALHADPAFPPYRKAAAPLIEKVKEEYKVEEVYMRPTDYSPLK